MAATTPDKSSVSEGMFSKSIQANEQALAVTIVSIGNDQEKTSTGDIPLPPGKAYTPNKTLTVCIEKNIDNQNTTSKTLTVSFENYVIALDPYLENKPSQNMKVPISISTGCSPNRKIRSLEIDVERGVFTSPGAVKSDIAEVLNNVDENSTKIATSGESQLKNTQQQQSSARGICSVTSPIDSPERDEGSNKSHIKDEKTEDLSLNYQTIVPSLFWNEGDKIIKLVEDKKTQKWTCAPLTSQKG